MLKPSAEKTHAVYFPCVLQTQHTKMNHQRLLPQTFATARLDFAKTEFLQRTSALQKCRRIMASGPCARGGRRCPLVPGPVHTTTVEVA